MGKKTYTSSTVVPLVTDSPNLAQQSVLTSIAAQTDIASDLVFNLKNGLASTLMTYYRVGAISDVNLIPTSNGAVLSSKALEVEYALESLVGKVDILIAEMKPLDADYLAYEYMAENWGYNHANGSFTSLPAGLNVSRTIFHNTIHKDGVLVIEYEDVVTGDIQEEVTDIEIGDTDTVWHHVVYKRTGRNKIEYWNYDTSTGVFPYLAPATFGINDNYFPAIPIVRYSKDMTANTSTAQYALSKQLCYILGLDLENLSSSLKESEDYEHMTQATFVPSVRMADTDPLALKYMFAYFSSLEARDTATKERFDNWVDHASIMPSHPTRVTEQFRSSSFKMDLSWYYITRKIVSTNWTRSADYYRSNSDSTLTYYREYSAGTNEYGEPITRMESVEIDTSSVSYHRKISATQKEVVTVYGLIHENHVDNSYSVESDVEEMLKGGSDDKQVASIPISPLLLLQVFPNLLERNMFVNRTFNLVLSFRVDIKLKWYQSSFFKFAMIVIAIVITVWSAGSLGASMSAAYTAAGAGLAGVIAAGSILLGSMLVGMAISYGLKVVAKELGIEAAILVAIIASAYTYNASDGFDAIKMAELSTQGINDYINEETARAEEDLVDVLEEQSTWQKEYDEEMAGILGLSESFAEIYKSYTEYKSIYNRMRPQTFIFVAVDMLTLAPELATSHIDTWVDSKLEPTSGNGIL